MQAFKANGIDIDAITIQNEPLYAAPYMSTEMSAQAQAEFIKTALGPAFEAAQIKTKIIIYDHNWDRVDYPLSVLSDADARKYVAGSAFHCYGGNVNAMNQVQTAYPDKGIYFTECSGGDFSPDFSNNLSWNSENLIIGSPRNGAKTVLFWNLALDENHGPRNGGCQDCRGVVTINSINKIVSKNVEYYALGHASKFLLPKAKRIETRFPDPAANPYLAFAALLMAGLDGIKNKTSPGDAHEGNLYDPEVSKGIPTVATSLREALEALDKDRAFLTAGGVFDDDFIDAYIELKMEESQLTSRAPHPIEYKMYYGV